MEQEQLYTEYLNRLLLHVPEVLAKERRWISSISVTDFHKLKTTKRPAVAVNDDSSFLSLNTCINSFLSKRKKSTFVNFGYVSYFNSPFCILDIDDSLSDPSFMSSESFTILSRLSRLTYSEHSLSGNSLHLVFTVTSPKPEKIAYLKSSSGWKGQLSLDRNFMIFTGEKYQESPGTVCSLDLSHLDELFTSNKKFSQWKDSVSEDNGVIAEGVNF